MEMCKWTYIGSGLSEEHLRNWVQSRILLYAEMRQANKCLFTNWFESYALNTVNDCKSTLVDCVLCYGGWCLCPCWNIDMDLSDLREETLMYVSTSVRRSYLQGEETLMSSKKLSCLSFHHGSWGSYIISSFRGDYEKGFSWKHKIWLWRNMVSGCHDYGLWLTIFLSIPGFSKDVGDQMLFRSNPV